MPKALLLSLILNLIFLSASVLAGSPPPTDALPLSQIIQTLEQRGDVAYFGDIEWEDDGYWEIEYITRDGQKREVKVDPVSGQIRED
jgi:hypothetical protein